MLHVSESSLQERVKVYKRTVLAYKGLEFLGDTLALYKSLCLVLQVSARLDALKAR
jgi:hypothetical protein